MPFTCSCPPPCLPLPCCALLPQLVFTLVIEAAGGIHTHESPGNEDKQPCFCARRAAMMLGDLFLFVRVKAFVGLNVLFLVHGGGPSRGQAAVSEDTVFLV